MIASSRTFAPAGRGFRLLSGGMFLLLVLSMGGPAALSQPRYGVVDYHLLLNLHPIMRQFNVQTGRFDGTNSSPVSGQTPEELKTRLEALKKQMTSLDDRIKSRLSRGGSGATQEYSRYWKRRQTLTEEHQLIREALLTGGLTGSLHEGVPSSETLMPICIKITQTILGILQDLQRRHGLEAIVNVGPLILNAEPPSPLPIPFNLHWKAWAGQGLSEPEIAALRASTKDLLQTLSPRRVAMPCKAGAKDLTAEAAKLLLDYLPAQGPDPQHGGNGMQAPIDPSSPGRSGISIQRKGKTSR